MPAPPIAVFVNSNSVSMTPDDPDYFILGQAPYGQTIQEWQGVVGYAQKVLFTDSLTIMVHTPTRFNTGTSEVVSGDCSLYICDKYKNVIADLNSAPYYKGKQTIAGNTLTVPGELFALALKTFCWNFTFASQSISTNDFYYLKMTNVGDPGNASTTTRTYYSEPMQLNTAWRNTRRIEYSYNSNIASKGIINSGWFDNYPTNSINYNLKFSFRCEMYINQFVPKVINIGYQQQSYDPLQIKTQQKSVFALKAGEISQGIPYYMLRALTEALLADNVAITTAYLSDNPMAFKIFTQSQPSLSDMWKIRDSDNSPLIYANCNITLVGDYENALVPTNYPGQNEYAQDEYAPGEYA